MAFQQDNKKLSVAILDDYQGVALGSADWTPLLARIDVTVFGDTLHDEKELANRLSPFEIICTMRERTKFSQALFDQLPNLRLLTTTAMGNRSIDVKAATAKGIIVCGTGATASSTLEHIWALILATARHVVAEHASIRAKETQWQHFVPTELEGKTLGVLGLGRFGKATAKIAKAFNMRVIAWSPHLTKERTDAEGVQLAETKQAFFENSDILSVHMVLAPDTVHLVKEEDLKRMKPNSFFINTSRGPIVDEEGLINVLTVRKIAGAGLDVFNTEPLPLDHPLRTLPNVTLSPHLGYVSDSAYKTFWGHTVENIEAFLDGCPMRVIK